MGHVPRDLQADIDREMRRYLVVCATKEAWVTDPFTRERFDVLRDSIQVSFTRGRAARRPFNDRLYEHDEGEPLVHAWLWTQRKLLVIGAPGSGKTVVTKQEVSFIAQRDLKRNAVQF